MESLNNINQLFVRQLVYSDNNIEIYVKRYLNDPQQSQNELDEQQQKQQQQQISQQELVSIDQPKEQLYDEEGQENGEGESLKEVERPIEFDNNDEQLINGQYIEEEEEVPDLDAITHDGLAFVDLYFQQINIQREIEQAQFNQLLEQFSLLSVSDELNEQEEDALVPSEPSLFEEENYRIDENEIESDISSISSFIPSQSEQVNENELYQEPTLEELSEASGYESEFVYESTFVYETEFEVSDQLSNEDELIQSEIDSIVSEGSELLELFASFESLDISGSEEMATTSYGSSASSTSSSVLEVYSEHPLIESVFGREYRFEYELKSFLDEEENEQVPPNYEMYQYEWPLSFESESNDDNFNLPSQHEEMVQELELLDSYSDCTTTESQSSNKDLYSVSYRF